MGTSPTHAAYYTMGCSEVVEKYLPRCQVIDQTFTDLLTTERYVNLHYPTCQQNSDTKICKTEFKLYEST